MPPTAVSARALKTVRELRRTQRRRYHRPLGAERLEERCVLATQTTGLFLNTSQAFDGYTLFSPQNAKTTYLINNEGTVINTWQSQFNPGLLAILREDGTLLRGGVQPGNPNINAPGFGGHLEILSWEGDLLWSFDYNTPQHLQHHDLEALPNGNILIMSWDFKTAAQAVQAGHDPAIPGPGALYPDTIVELRPNLAAGTGADIVWQWSVWDHLVQDRFPARDNYLGPGGVSQHPELVDINYVNTTIGTGTASAPQDFTHANSVDYNPELDLIMISVREYNEIWIIDHSTTTAQAAGHTGGRSGKGGDLLWRWGNPETYDRGTPADRKLFWQHDANWVVDGVNGNVDNIVLFNNGWGRGPNQNINLSSADEIRPPITISTVGGVTTYQFAQPAAGQPYGPSDLTWTYVLEPQFFSPIISGARRLPNGNTLLTSGIHGAMIEVNQAKQIVWKYVNPVTGVGPLARNEPIPPNNPGAPGVFGQIKANFVFKAIRYAPDFPGFVGKDLDPQFRTTVGLYDPSTFTWYLNDEIGGSIENLTIFQSPPVPSSWVPFTGDWNGDGKDSAGLWDPVNFTWYLNNDVDGSIDDMLVFRTPPVPASWIPVAGDWNGDGLDTVGLYNPSTQTWYLNNRTDGSITDLISFKTLNAGASWRPLAGDWDGDGIDTIGLYYPKNAAWHLYNEFDGTYSSRVWFRTPIVPTWWIPLVGDWNDDGLDTVGLYDQFNNTWYTNDETDGTIDSVRVFRTPTVPSTWQPIAGNWDGSGIHEEGAPPSGITRAAASSSGAGPPVPLGEGEAANLPEQNPFNALDVDGDGSVAPTDAVLVINVLNQPPGSDLPPPVTDDAYLLLDVDGDAVVSPQDVILIINQLNAASAESSESDEPGPQEGADDAALALAISDLAGSSSSAAPSPHSLTPRLLAPGTALDTSESAISLVEKSIVTTESSKDGTEEAEEDWLDAALDSLAADVSSQWNG